MATTIDKLHLYFTDHETPVAEQRPIFSFNLELAAHRYNLGWVAVLNFTDDARLIDGICEDGEMLFILQDTQRIGVYFPIAKGETIAEAFGTLDKAVEAHFAGKNWTEIINWVNRVSTFKLCTNTHGFYLEDKHFA